METCQCGKKVPSHSGSGRPRKHCYSCKPPIYCVHPGCEQRLTTTGKQGRPRIRCEQHSPVKGELSKDNKKPKRLKRKYGKDDWENTWASCRK